MFLFVCGAVRGLAGGHKVSHGDIFENKAVASLNKKNLLKEQGSICEVKYLKQKL